MKMAGGPGCACGTPNGTKAKGRAAPRVAIVTVSRPE
jgi:hypothetical protein